MFQTMTWIATGLLVGWLARLAMRDGHDEGPLGDLVTGLLGAVLGGWLTRRLDLVRDDNLLGLVAVSVIGAALLLAAVRALRRILHSGLSSNPQTSTMVGDLEDQVKRLSAIERRVLSSMLHRRPPADPNQAFDEQMTFGARVADRVARFGGSWLFIGLFLTAMVVWMEVNADMAQPYDPFPFILLNLVLSCVASLQAPVIMMSQNRQSLRDRADAKSDYEVNLRAEMEIVSLHHKLDAAREQEWKRMTEIMSEQTARLERIEQKLGERR